MTRTSAPPNAPAVAPRAPRAALPVMTLAAGLSVAGNYFAQPLLGVLRAELHMSATVAGLVVAVFQIGYALGLALLVPLGDRYPRRDLAAALLAATGVLLALAGLAPNGPLLLAATGLVAVTSVGAQVLVPFAAEIGPPERRARDVGVVMAGVLGGGLAGRAFSGAVADVAGWRSVYWITAALLLAVAVAVLRTLPATAAAGTRPGALLRSTAALLVELPALRRPVAVAALGMAGYSAHLATLTFLLDGPPYRWSASTIGLAGLIGAVGPLCMPLAGRFVDGGHPRAVLLTGLALATASWAVLLPARDGGAGWLAAGIVLLNIGQTAMLNASQNISYELRPEARGRINAVFMTLFFAGGAAGGVLAPLAWSAGGWGGVCGLAAALTGLALLAALRPYRA
ncbi:MFS transporter [Actinomadura parmotrematis]|uniref:MFS transporter n=1 Tax=Actinomadura parmotrematis TaxID=2864039 RepID=A0ABS7FUA6_9ACTN|nr:MFS transporter [Actinomadura parmotrematis]MBW8483775.1 MFS transporter [Actinomadura parmotrematis]